MSQSFQVLLAPAGKHAGRFLLDVPSQHATASQPAGHTETASQLSAALMYKSVEMSIADWSIAQGQLEPMPMPDD